MKIRKENFSPAGDLDLTIALREAFRLEEEALGKYINRWDENKAKPSRNFTSKLLRYITKTRRNDLRLVFKFVDEFKSGEELPEPPKEVVERVKKIGWERFLQQAQKMATDKHNQNSG